MNKLTKWAIPFSLLLTAGVHSGAIDASAKTVTKEHTKQTSMSNHTWHYQSTKYNTHRYIMLNNCFTNGTNANTHKPTTKPNTDTSKPNTDTSKPNTDTNTTTPSKPNTDAPSKPSTDSNATSASQFEKQVITLTNAERAKEGLPALQADTKLMGSAKAKSKDMADKNYFDHTSPTYGSPFDQMKSLGITYKSAGENIAKGQKTPEEVVKAWMNSEGHRANIMNKNYTHIGVGYDAKGNVWTQQFIQK
ncbi:CAP domain-containing protein [Rummeliibacillus sp. G93]|uniref:CAP domain-containing protein n=1 Tax=Rummeliibacillus sp. G93 TaxID=2939494 RepID=UPI00201C3F32|nr:CAP domain-containing protein [Rummeliibacillus sp. G93]UQW96209.1 CAP domain-containing protein [Rummeliibacillus sp. G93]